MEILAISNEGERVRVEEIYEGWTLDWTAQDEPLPEVQSYWTVVVCVLRKTLEDVQDASLLLDYYGVVCRRVELVRCCLEVR